MGNSKRPQKMQSPLSALPAKAAENAISVECTHHCQQRLIMLLLLNSCNSNDVTLLHLPNETLLCSSIIQSGILHYPLDGAFVELLPGARSLQTFDHAVSSHHSN